MNMQEPQEDVEIRSRAVHISDTDEAIDGKKGEVDF